MLNKIVFAVTLIMLSMSAHAAPFLEYGLGASFGSCIYQSWERNGDVTKINCTENPLGFVALGYEYNGFTIQAEHWSSLKEKDYGVNFISVRHRITF